MSKEVEIGGEFRISAVNCGGGMNDQGSNGVLERVFGFFAAGSAGLIANGIAVSD